MEIQLTDQEKTQQILSPYAVYGIMQRILLRENEIDQDKEHFWMMGLDGAGHILYIELVSLGTRNSTPVEPMNVYRLAVLKNADRVIAIHNHPSGLLTPSATDKDLTDRLIAVGRILCITMEDHLIISTRAHLSFKAIGLMKELRASLRYVPGCNAVEKIRMEQSAIAKLAAKEEIKTAKQKAKAIAEKKIEAAEAITKAAKEAAKKAEEKARTEAEKAKIERTIAKEAKALAKEKEQALSRSIRFLADKNMTAKEIANMLKITPEEVEQAIKKKK